MTRPDLIVTRHAPLLALLRELGLYDGDIPVLAHATPDDVRGKRVLGVLPLRLAAECDRVIEIPLDLSPADRGAMASGDLPLARLREIAGAPVEYSVCRTDEVSMMDLDAMETSRAISRG